MKPLSMSNTNQPKAALWVPEEELLLLIAQAYKRSAFADILLGDIVLGKYGYGNEKTKLLLREMYCLVETNRQLFDDSLNNEPFTKDGQPGYLVSERDLLSLTTLSVNLRSISADLLEQGISLEPQ